MACGINIQQLLITLSLCNSSLALKDLNTDILLAYELTYHLVYEAMNYEHLLLRYVLLAHSQYKNETV